MAPLAIVLLGLVVVVGVWALASSPVGEAVAQRIVARADRDLEERISRLERRVGTLEDALLLEGGEWDELEGGQ